VALTVALVVLVSLFMIFAFYSVGLIWPLAVVLLVCAAICATRQAADDWFDAVDESLGGAGG
jgi:hypothetical protein